MIRQRATHVAAPRHSRIAPEATPAGIRAYTFAWTDVPAGAYSITAVATDDRGAMATSTTETVAITAPGGPATTKVFYIHADQINTPHEITNAADVKVWEAGSGPFGADLPNEKPSAGEERFVYNQRFPGQYFDAETGLHYNYFRDYDPQSGRYVQSDPIGLAGGINTYGYVGGNPLSATDPDGLNPVWAIGRAGRTGWSIGQAINPYVQPYIATVLDAIFATNHQDATGNPAVDRANPAVARQMEYERAKNFCDQGPPQGSDECSNISKTIDDAKEYVKLYSRWDAKWIPAHTEKIRTWENRIQKYKDAHQKKSPQTCWKTYQRYCRNMRCTPTL